MKDGLGELLESCDCRTWLYSEGGAFSPEAALAESGVKVHQFRNLDWCLDAEGSEHYAYDKTYEEGKNDEILIIHTGGTTGMKKNAFPIHIN